MKFSDDRITHLAFLIHRQIRDGRLADFTDEDKAMREIKRTIIAYLKVEEEADEAARGKVASLKRGVSEGSREWEILYRKYFEEELTKRGR